MENTRDTISAVDSAYVSAASANDSPSTVYIRDERPEMPQTGRRIEGTDLFIFKKAVSQEALRRYRNVRLAIEDFITEEISANQYDRSCNMAIALRIVGKTEQDAILHLVVFCAPEVESRIKNLMNLPAVTMLLNYSRPNVTSLPYLIVLDPPRTTSAHLGIDVCCNNLFMKERRTFCGAPVLLRTNTSGPYKREKRQATFGGIISVTYANGESKAYGMTAGHLLDGLQIQDGSHGISSSQTPSQILSTCKIDEWICEHNIIGQVLDPSGFPGVSAGNATLSHDWALFNVKAPRPNMAVPATTQSNGRAHKNEPGYNILQADRPKFKDDLSDPVLLLSGTNGTRRGELSNLPTRIWIGHSNAFVDAYTLELEDSNDEHSLCHIESTK